MPNRVKLGKIVSITYLIHNPQGNIVEYSDLPVSYLHGGRHDLFPQIEQALTGKKVGDAINIELTPDQAFGQHNPNLTFTDDIENAPEEIRFIGAELDAEGENGQVLHFRVTHITDGKITIDANHPFAGQDINYTVTVSEIRDPSVEEIKQQGLTH